MRLNTAANGLADFKMTNNDTTIGYKVNITGISNTTGGHIHMGKMGQSGDVVVDLFQTGFNKHKKTSYRMIIRENITYNTLKGPMKGTTIAGLVSAMEIGNVYVNIPTKNHLTGEIRGQIERSNGAYLM